MGKQHKIDKHEKIQDYIHEIRKQHEREGYADAGPETKGGEYHRGPKRWTGRGPAPARHIPWPELFKHHISVVEGHQKMMDMVRKHIVEDTPNHRMIMGILNRCRTMIGDTKQIAYAFVPPPQARNEVPLGSSSASMYPGYSPADHIYGEAAADYGTHVRDMQKLGHQVKTPGDVEYTVNQKETTKRRLMERARNNNKEANQSSGDDQQGSSNSTRSWGGQQNHHPTATNGTSTSTNAANPSTTEPTTNGHTSDPNLGPDGQPLFVIDINPTQVDLPNFDNPHKPKKAKLDHDGKLPSAEPETEDISAEVDAKLKAKKEKKEEKKRKRESGEGEKPKKKKKSKKDEKAEKEADEGEGDVGGAEDVEMKDVDNEDVGTGEEGKKKRKRKEKRKEGNAKKKRVVEA